MVRNNKTKNLFKIAIDYTKDKIKNVLKTHSLTKQILRNTLKRKRLKPSNRTRKKIDNRKE